jgi:hypothetical protein
MKDCCTNKTNTTSKPKNTGKKLIALSIILSSITSFLLGIAVDQVLIKKASSEPKSQFSTQSLADLYEQVLPQNGFRTKIKLGDSIMKLQESGAIDKEKFLALYEQRGGLPEELEILLHEPSDKMIHIDKHNAQFYVNLLWALGLNDKSLTLEESPAAKPENINILAATAGWTLGKEEGPSYYNKDEIIKLDDRQEQLVKKISENIYRPCCGNHTGFPDCNHGAAMLGLLQLGISQGLSEKELYEEALKFNAFWFPDQYTKMASMFKYTQNKNYKDIDAKKLLSADYSSGSGYRTNVVQPLSQLPGLLPQSSGGGGCSA